MLFWATFRKKKRFIHESFRYSTSNNKTINLGVLLLSIIIRINVQAGRCKYLSVCDGQVNVSHVALCEFGYGQRKIQVTMRLRLRFWIFFYQSFKIYFFTQFSSFLAIFLTFVKGQKGFDILVNIINFVPISINFIRSSYNIL